MTIKLKTVTYHNANFVITGSTTCRHNVLPVVTKLASWQLSISSESNASVTHTSHWQGSSSQRWNTLWWDIFAHLLVPTSANITAAGAGRDDMEKPNPTSNFHQTESVDTTGGGPYSHCMNVYIKSLTQIYDNILQEEIVYINTFTLDISSTYLS